MELYPGTKLSAEQLKDRTCNSKYNAIKKAFADFTGRPYVITPTYNRTIKNKDVNKNEKIKNLHKKTRKNLT